MATLILGRDGMGGSAAEEDFSSWVLFLCRLIDERCGFEVDVDERDRGGVQSDTIIGATDEQRQTIDEAKRALWDEWCAARSELVHVAAARYLDGEDKAIAEQRKRLASELRGLAQLATRAAETETFDARIESRALEVAKLAAKIEARADARVRAQMIETMLAKQ